MARYVKLLIDKGTNPFGHPGYLTITEIQIFSNNLNVAKGKPNNDQNGNYIIGVNNGIIETLYENPMTYLLTLYTGLEPMGSEWINIDLQTNINVDKITVSTMQERGFGAVTDYRIMFSNNNIDFWLAATTINGASGVRTDTITDIDNGAKYIYLHNNDIYGVVDDDFKKLTDTKWNNLSDDNKLIIINNIHGIANIENIKSILPCKIIKYYNASIMPNTTIIAVPETQHIFPIGLISISHINRINKLTIISEITNADILIAFTNNLIDYTIYNFNTNLWEMISKEDISINGMKSDTVSNITKLQLDLLFTPNWTNIGVAYSINMTNIDGIANIDTLSILADLNGNWGSVIEGDDFIYEYSNNNIYISLLNNGDYKINYGLLK